jgi:hypothetical protein
MELELASPNEKEKMQIRQYQAQAAPLAQQEKGMGGQMMDMAKQRAMEGALDAGQAGITSALSGSAAPVVGSAIEGGAVLGPMAGGAGAGMGAGMAALGTAVPYVGAGLLAGKALGLFNEGGMVGPLSLQYRAEGTMTPEQARALMMNEPEPQAPPMINPDQLYNEIVAESMTEAAQGQIPPTPTMRPPLMVDPLGADTTYSPYNMMRPDNVPST